MALDSLDPQARYDLTSAHKSNEWLESFRDIKDLVINNISANLRLKATKKV
jgi:hypothetical protein